MLNIFSKKPPEFFSQQEQQKIVAAIKSAESQTSGEIRLYVESRCRYVDALDRAVEVFGGLNMFETAARNGVLVYLAMRDRQFAVFGDTGIDAKVGSGFWKGQAENMKAYFAKQDYATGLEQMILSIGQSLKAAFPYAGESDINELPDDIVYGK